MKLLYTSVYRDGSGYAQAAKETIRAIKTTNIELVCRPIKLNNSRNEKTPDDILENEQNDLNNVDAIVQHALPHMFQYKSGVKNIGFFDWETTHFKRSNWAQYLNIMDEIWVPCVQNKQACVNSGVTKPIKIVPHPFNPNRLKQTTIERKLNLFDKTGKTIFYTIGEMTKRKNLAGLIRAYYHAFSNLDDVVLFIKTNIPGQNPEEARQNIIKYINDIKRATHMYLNKDNYPKIILCTDRLSENEINYIHKNCHIYISPSHGEAWGLDTQISLAFGNPVIVSAWGGLFDICVENAETWWQPEKNKFKLGQTKLIKDMLIDGNLTPCFGMVDGFLDLYTGDELWFEPDILELSNRMKFYHENRNFNYTNYQQIGMRFSHQAIGEVIEGILNV